MLLDSRIRIWWNPEQDSVRTDIFENPEQESQLEQYSVEMLNRLQFKICHRIHNRILSKLLSSDAAGILNKTLSDPEQYSVVILNRIRSKS